MHVSLFEKYLQLNWNGNNHPRISHFYIIFLPTTAIKLLVFSTCVDQSSPVASYMQIILSNVILQATIWAIEVNSSSMFQTLFL